MKQAEENLIGYILDSLDDDSRQETEAYLASHPEAQQHVDALRVALAPLGADRADAAPPADLIYRTLGRIAEYCSRDLPRAPATSPVQVNFRPPWRRVELLVAASVLIVALGLGVSSLVKLRNASPVVECQRNLLAFYQALSTYHDQHKHFPDVKAEAPHDAAGMLVPLLVSSGALDPAEISIRCPGNGAGKPCPLTYEQAKALDADEFARMAPKLMPCYAYSLGHYQGNIYSPPQIAGGLNAQIPLMSDRPPFDMQPGNSPNHGGDGQNILFQDGHVTYKNVRSLEGDDDIFLNRNKTVGAGVDANDACLGQSGARP